MKTLTKIFAMALTFIMVLSLATAAFAVDVTISVINSESGASVTGHEYKVYQIFTGTVAADGVTLSDIVAGESLVDNADVDAILAAIKDMDGATAAEYLKNNDLLGDVFAELNDDKGFSVTAPAGYYLIIDDSKDLPATETASAVILQVLEDVAIHSKHDSSPIILKKVDDINDSNTSELEIQWHDSADHDIGDEIPFQLTAVLPSSFDAFELAGQKYPFTFHDTEEIGLAYIADSAKAYYVDDEGKKVEISTEQYSIVEDAAHKNDEGTEYTHSFDVVFPDLTQVDGIHGGTTILVEYKSELTEDAIIGSLGNPNEVYGEYRNLNYPENPKFTPKDRVIVFTYKVNVDKYKEEVKDGNELTGAVFTLYKEVPAPAEGATTSAKTGAEIKRGFADNIKASELKDDKYYIVIAATEAESDGDTFGFKGVDDGNYVLVETTVPNGYNAWESEAFTITAEHDVESDAPQLTKLEGGDLFTGGVDIENGVLDTDITNNSGIKLPETGGIGTTIFYVVGALLVVGAGVLLVTKKRMNSAE